MGCRILACDPYRDDVDGDLQGKVRHVDFATLKREADVLSIHCHLTPETKGMVDREFSVWLSPSPSFSSTRPGALL